MNTSQASKKKAKPATRRGRPVGDREAKRVELLTAAIAVIAEDGYSGASLRRVAQRASCTTGAVTYYFANKEGMVTAVAEYLFDDFDKLLKIEEEQIEVRAILEQWLNLTRSGKLDTWLAMFQLLAHARHEPEFAAIFHRRYVQYRRALAAILEREQRKGTVRDDIPADLLADNLSAMGDGWIMMFPIEPKRFKPSRVKALLDTAITLISPPKSAAR